MWRYILLVAACYGWQSGVGASECQRAVGGDYFREEVLLEDDGLRGPVATYWSNNTIYFLKESASSQLEVLAWNIATEALSVLAELPEYCFLTVDQQRGHLYAGCWNNKDQGGLYIYDHNIQKFVRLINRVEFIDWVHFADRLYYVTNPDYKLWSYEHGVTRQERELEDKIMWTFVKDGKGGSVSAYYGVVSHRRVGAAAAATVTPGDYIDRLATSSRGEVFGAGRFSGDIYHIDTDTDTLFKVLDTPGDCYGLAIDKDDNFICIIVDSSPKRVLRYVRCTQK